MDPVATSESPAGTILLCVVAPPPAELEDGGSVGEAGIGVVEGFRAKDASRSPALSPVDDSDTSEVDDCPFSAGVKVGVVVIAEVAEVGVASAPSSCESDEVRASSKVSRSDVDT